MGVTYLWPPSPLLPLPAWVPQKQQVTSFPHRWGVGAVREGGHRGFGFTRAWLWEL